MNIVKKFGRVLFVNFLILGAGSIISMKAIKLLIIYQLEVTLVNLRDEQKQRKSPPTIYTAYVLKEFNSNHKALRRKKHTSKQNKQQTGNTKYYIDTHSLFGPVGLCL